MAQTAYGPRRADAIGSFTRIWSGVGGGSGTSTTITLPAGVRVKGAGAMGGTSTTAVYVATVSANTFIVTHANNDLFFWIADTDGGI